MGVEFIAVAAIRECIFLLDRIEKLCPISSLAVCISILFIMLIYVATQQSGQWWQTRTGRSEAGCKGICWETIEILSFDLSLECHVSFYCCTSNISPVCLSLPLFHLLLQFMFSISFFSEQNEMHSWSLLLFPAQLSIEASV